MIWTLFLSIRDLSWLFSLFYCFSRPNTRNREGRVVVIINILICFGRRCWNWSLRKTATRVLKLTRVSSTLSWSEDIWHCWSQRNTHMTTWYPNFVKNFGLFSCWDSKVMQYSEIISINSVITLGRRDLSPKKKIIQLPTNAELTICEIYSVQGGDALLYRVIIVLSWPSFS